MRSFERVVQEQELLNDDLLTICDDLRDEMSALEGTRVLITGGGGFLGYYLVQSALAWNRDFAQSAPIDVTVYDNYARGVPTWLEALSGDPRLHLVRQDMTRPLPRDMGHFDWIVHAAGIASPTYYRAHPLQCIDANIVGLRNLLEYACERGRRGEPIRGFLFFSSSEIYGDPAADAIPTPESYRGNVSCTGPRACYDESKRFGETLCVTFAQQEGVPVKIARPFNNYGPGLKITDGRVIPDFAQDVFSGRDIKILSDGSPTRTFCYATDAITGYYKVLVKGGSGEPYNIGIDRPEISMRNLAELIVETARRLFGYRGSAIFGKASEADYLVDNPNRRCPNVDKARSQLGFNPRVEPAEGVARSLVWYHHNRSGTSA